MNEQLILLVDKCDKHLEKLSKSPSFIMSLGAKELFHSNFLAFLLETEDESLKQVQNNLKELFGLESEKKVYVWREKSNLDLVLIQLNINDEKSWNECTPKTTIIENKLKSIPTETQLIKYDLKIKKGISFDFYDPSCWTNIGKIDQVKICKERNELALMVKGEGVDKIRQYKNKKEVEINRYIISIQCFKNNVGWESVQWEVIQGLIKKGLSDKRNSDNELIIKLVEDYSETLEYLISVAKNTITFCNEYQDISNYIYKDFYNQITSYQFKNLRIHDLVGKIAFNQLEFLLKNNLKLNSEPDNYEFNSYAFYSNQQPGLGLEWAIYQEKGNKREKKFSIGIQIQGSDYRHFVEVPLGSSKLYDFGNKQLKYWFYPTLNELLGFSGKNNNNELFKFDKNKFIYTKININEFTFYELRLLIFNSMKHAIKVINKYDLPNDNLLMNLNIS